MVGPPNGIGPHTRPPLAASRAYSRAGPPDGVAAVTTYTLPCATSGLPTLAPRFTVQRWLRGGARAGIAMAPSCAGSSWSATAWGVPCGVGLGVGVLVGVAVAVGVAVGVPTGLLTSHRAAPSARKASPTAA